MSTGTGAQFLYEKITADSTLAAAVGTRVYIDIAPNNATMPFIVISMAAGRVIAGTGPAVIWYDEDWQVRVADQSMTYANCETIADRLRTVLHGASGTAGSVNVWACRQDAEARFTQIEEGLPYRYISLIFNLEVQGA